MLDLRKLKQNYVGVVYIYDLKTKKVLRQGGGHFDVEGRRLDVLFDCEEVYRDVEWVPILQTEQGYFCPAQSTKGHLIGSVFTFDHRSTFSMSSFFHWKSELGIDHITNSFDTVYIEVAGQNGGYPLTTFNNKMKTAEMTTKGEFKEIEQQSSADLDVAIKAIWSSNRTTVQQKVRFIIKTHKARFSRTDWAPLTNAFRLYWLFQHDRTNCNTTVFSFGDELDFVTNILQLRGYDDNTDIVHDALNVETPMNAQLLADTCDFFLNQVKVKGRGGIEFGFYRLLGYRFGTGTKRIGDDLLDLVFGLDGFCADINKSAQRKLSKAEKQEVRASIQKILDNIEQIKDILDSRVYEFYSQPEEKIFASIVRKPYRESVQQCFETLNMDYSQYEDTVIAVDEIRQIFVHGKSQDTDDLVGKIYTHGTTTINESSNGKETQIMFGQTTGLAEKYYKMIRLLFLHYFQKDDPNPNAVK